MSLSAGRVPPGPSAVAWLDRRISAAKAADPLTPVTVVVPNHYVGLFLRDHWAETAYANVRTFVTSGLAEAFGARLLASRGQSPLTTSAEEAVIRKAVREAGADFGQAGDHPAVVQALRMLFRDIEEHEVSAPLREQLATQNLIAKSAFESFPVYRSLLTKFDLYGRTDLIIAATEAVDNRSVSEVVREVGSILVYLITGITPAEARFFAALGHQSTVEVALPYLQDATADAEAATNASRLGFDWDNLADYSASTAVLKKSVMVASDSIEEVLSVVRQVLADIERGLLAHRIAIVYRSESIYGAAVRETLRAAGLPWAALGGRSLLDSWAGSCLLRLLRLPDSDFSRTAVLNWLSTIPNAPSEWPSVSDWDGLSREAGVVKGTAQWTGRLRLYAAELREELQELAHHEEASEGFRGYLEHRVEAAETMAIQVEELAREIAAPEPPTWSNLVDWARRLRQEYVPIAGDWPIDEQEAGELVDDVVGGLATAGSIEGPIDMPRFLQTLENVLRSRRQPDGRLGEGIVVGPLGSIIGMTFDRVYMLGVTEAAFPSPLPIDPIIAAEPGTDPLDRRARRTAAERRAFLAAGAAASGGRVQLSFAAWDEDLRPTYPSGWLVDVAQELAGRPVSSLALREMRPEPWLRCVQSPEAGLSTAPSVLNLAEHRVLAARDWVSAGRALVGSPLARRGDLPLGRNLEVQSSRWAPAFTAFDGNLGDVAGESSKLSNGLAFGPISATAIEVWSHCPFRYFMGRILRVEATNRIDGERFWSISPLAKGNVIHRIMRRFFQELRADKRPAPKEVFSIADHDRIESIANEEFEMLERRGETGHRLVWENDRIAMLLDLHTVLAKDEELRSEGFVPAHFEQSFGLEDPSWPGPSIEMPDGRQIRFRGYIDRIDLAPDSVAPRRARILDYKTGRAFAPKDIEVDVTAGGTRLQLAAYSMALREHTRRQGLRDPVTWLAYWFITTRGEFALREVPAGRAAARLGEVLEVVDRGIRAGAFLQVPGEEQERPGISGWENCFYCEYNRVCPAARDQIWQRKKDADAAAIHLELKAATPGDG